MKITNPFFLKLFNDIKENFVTIILSIFGIILFIYSGKLLYNYYSSVDCIINYKNYTISNKQQLEPNEFGDYFGGVMNPLIGITAAFITFLAFYIQYVANKKITNQFKIQQFESQFYEMIRLHKENVNEIEINQIELKKRYNDTGIMKGYSPESTIVRAREVFVIYANELEIVYRIIVKYQTNKKKAFDSAYKIFFNGLHLGDDRLAELSTFQKKHKEAFLEKTTAETPKYILDNIPIKAKYSLFEGHENKLGHYYRHLYHTVKFVVNYDNTIINYTEKRKYLRLLRAQLSNYEQLMLFYNWYSGYGENWEINKFFSNYRMIHNLPNNIFFDFDKDHFLAVKESIRKDNPEYKMLDDKDFLYESDNKK